MALRWIDGFDALGGDSADVTALIQQCGYTFVPSGNGPYVYTYANTATGIGFSMRANGGHPGYGQRVVFNFAAQTKTYVGFRLFSANSFFDGFFQFGLNNGADGIVDQLKLFINGENGITLTQGGSVTNFYDDPFGTHTIVAVSPPNVLFPNTWQYIEVFVWPQNQVTVRIDGTQVINVTGSTVTTVASPSLAVAVNYVSFGNDNINSNNILYDDFYMLDDSGSSFNTFLGDVVVHSVFPNADAGPNTMTQFGGGSGHFTSIEEQTPDGDSSYVTSSTSGQQEMYSLSTIPSDVLTVLAVSVNALARKTDAGTATYDLCIKHSGTELDSSSVTASMTYIQGQYIFTTPPGGGSWNTSIAQNSTIGVKIP